MIRKKGKSIVTCDKCHRAINNIKPKHKKEGDIEYKYMTCRRCGAVYVISATDEALRQSIKHFTDLTAGKAGVEMTESEQKEAELLLQANVARSRELKEQYPIKLKPWER